MSDPALTAALANIAATLALLQQQVAAQPPAAAIAAPHAPTLQLFDNGSPFDMASRAGSAAMTLAASPLSCTWDGTLDKLPAFLSSLKKRALEAKWYAPAPHGILLFPPHDLLSSYHAIPLQDIELAASTRTDPRSIQNSLAMFKCLSDSIDGDLKSIFDQAGNLPSTEDGPTLFKRLTELTVANSSLLSAQALDELSSLEPADYKFNIPALNSRFNNFFTLAATSSRSLSDNERIQMLLRVYRRIRQPASWHSWVNNRYEDLDNGALPGPPNAKHITLMNSAVLFSLKITNDKEYPVTWKSTSLEQDVVSMSAVTAASTPTPAPRPSNRRPPQAGGGSRPTTDLPPFARHYKASASPDAARFVVGESKVHNGVTWFFCDAPHPHNKVRWHSYPATDCRTRTQWLANGSPRGSSAPTAPPVAALADDNGSTSGSVSVISSPPASDLTALLAQALALPDATDATRAFIADALNAAHHF